MEIYTKILDKFKTHIIIEDDLTIIREHFKYLKNIDLIIKNLKQNQIFYIYQIKKYTTQNLEKLFLLGKLEDSAKFCYDLKNFANKFQRNKTIFIYKKFSEFKNKKRVYKYIQDMLTSKKIKYIDLCTINSVKLEIIKELKEFYVKRSRCHTIYK